MILPLCCHATFPRALALIEWKLNLLTFFSACYRLSTRCQCSCILSHFLISNIFKNRREPLSFIGISLEIVICCSMHNAALQVQLLSCSSALQLLRSGFCMLVEGVLCRHNAAKNNDNNNNNILSSPRLCCCNTKGNFCNMH